MELKKWNEMPAGGLIVTAGNSIEYHTGSWRSSQPDIDMERCTHCMLCWIFCPEGCVVVENKKVKAINMDYCKGCGICAVECPRKAITMVDEISVKKGA